MLWSGDFGLPPPGHMDEDTENSPGQPTAGPRRSAQREAAELRACEPFIQGMLKNYSACGCLE